MNLNDAFIGQARQCALKFRLGRDVEAGLTMIDLVAAIQPSFDHASAEAQRQWLQILGAMLECQEAQNWLALADYLEYELVQLIGDTRVV